MRKKFMSGRNYRIIFILILGSLLYGCDRDRNHPGWDYFPDMFYSTAYETFSKNPNFKDGMTMRAPVPGTVPRDYTPFNYTIDPESRIRAGEELVNPFTPTTENMERGKKMYDTFCMGCHGVKGGGDGNLYTSGLYPLQPRILTEEKIKKLKDGEIFHTITLGFGSMGAHGSQIRPEDRWKLVLFIRSLQENSQSLVVENKSK
jgi:mono/diheme cytochrome c family protein